MDFYHQKRYFRKQLNQDNTYNNKYIYIQIKLLYFNFAIEDPTPNWDDDNTISS